MGNISLTLKMNKLNLIGIICVLSVLGLFAYIHSFSDVREQATLVKEWEDNTTSDCPYMPRPENAIGFDPTICEWVIEKTP